MVGPATRDLLAVGVQGVPAEAHQGQGEGQPRGAVGQGVQRAEGESYVPLFGGESIAHIDGRDGLDKEGYKDVGEADVGDEEVGCAFLQVIQVPDRAEDHQVDENPNHCGDHLYHDQDDALHLVLGIHHGSSLHPHQHVQLHPRHLHHEVLWGKCFQFSVKFI